MTPLPRKSDENSFVLALDTSGERLGLALWQPKTDKSFVFQEDMQRRHSEALHGELSALLAAAHIDLADIFLTCATRGPGSFTGVRIGLAAALGLQRAQGMPLVALTTLEVLAHPHLGAGRPVTVWLDAARGEVYSQTFATDGVPVTQPAALPLAEAKSLLPANSLLCGGGAALVEDLPPGVSLLKDEAGHLHQPDPLALARLGLAAHSRGEGTEFAPLYLSALRYRKISERKP